MLFYPCHYSCNNSKQYVHLDLVLLLLENKEVHLSGAEEDIYNTYDS